MFAWATVAFLTAACSLVAAFSRPMPARVATSFVPITTATAPPAPAPLNAIDQAAEGMTPEVPPFGAAAIAALIGPGTSGMAPGPATVRATLVSVAVAR
jgi:hypothetical protein